MKYASSEWDGKRPSKPTLWKTLRGHIKQGAEHITLTWGENQITIEKLAGWIGPNGPWTGNGWIKVISGWDMAAQLNKEIRDAR